jgi:OOP family OmpA-OmpF porin
MMKSVLAALSLGLALAALPAAAQIYVGAGAGQSKAKDFCGGGGGFDTCDDKDTAWKAYGGYAFTPNFAVEIGYSDFGKFKATLAPFTDEAKVTAWEISAIGAFPIVQQLLVFGRLGLYRATVKEDTNFAGSFENDNNDFTYGLGLQYNITRHLSLRGEWQRYNKVGGGDVAFGAGVGEKSNLDVLGVSALWRF